MDRRIQPRTEAGRRFCELAEIHADEAGAHAGRHDREGTFPTEVFDSMKQSGFLNGTVPEEFGGLGVASAQDVAAGLSRLGHGDGSTAIAATMHFAFGLIAGRTLKAARVANDETTIEQMGGYLAILGGGAIGAANATEPGTDLRYPLVEATKVEGGWSITGRKIFSTLSPVADLFFVPFRTPGADGGYESGFAIVPRGSAGQNIHDNWNALGMRASGSHDIVYDACFVPDAFATVGGPWGADTDQSLVVATAGSIGLLASFLGVAEAARDVVVEQLQTRTKAPSGRVLAARHGIQHNVATMETDLETCRAVIERTARHIDEVILDRPAAETTLDDLHEVNARFQAAKLVANRKAIEVVDMALTLSGGAGYLSGSVLSRLYRDVRAGPFMQPLSPNEVHEYMGRVALGLSPETEH
jgi:alkylation response protein AidB-like acyl-CoA dehydrogenase